jgi:Fe2+ transport system protein FeoA
MPLSKVPIGSIVEIKALDASPELGLRFEALGLHAGERLEVLRNRAPSPLIVASAGARLMLGRDMASRVAVNVLGGIQA